MQSKSRGESKRNAADDEESKGDHDVAKHGCPDPADSHFKPTRNSYNEFVMTENDFGIHFKNRILTYL